MNTQRYDSIDPPSQSDTSAPTPAWEHVSFWVTVSLAVLLLSAIIYPFFGGYFSRPRILVFDANGAPVPYARLTFQNNPVMPGYFVLTDGKGQSYDRYATKIADSVTGEYALQYIVKNTGNERIWVFSTRGTQTLTVRDEDGRVLPGFQLRLQYPTEPLRKGYSRPSRALMGNVYSTDNQGRLILPNVALAQRLGPEPEDESFTVRSVRVTTGKYHVDYDVRVTRSATISGTLKDRSGNGIRNVPVFAELTSGPRFSWGHPLTRSDERGNFRMTGLVPGTYKVGSPDGSGRSVSAGPTPVTVTVVPGETGFAALRMP